MTAVKNTCLKIYDKLTCNKLSQKHPMLYFTIAYTALFIFLALIAFSVFIIHDKSFVWDYNDKDGLLQHFNSLEYFGVYLRDIIRNFFNTGQLSIPLYDFSIGFGGDILTTFNYYVIGDPLNLLSVFVPSRYTELLYCFLIILRLYFAGLAFSVFALHFTKKKNKTYVLIGAMAYVFCGYALYASVRHPYFTNPMIYFPLILLGMEHIFDKKRPYLFIFSVFLSAVSNFYFFYMIVLLTVIYAVFRFFMIYKSHRVKAFFTCILKIGGSAVLATLAAGAVFIPVVTALLSSNRSTSDNNLQLFYNIGYYVRFLSAFVSDSIPGKWSITGYCPLAFFSIISLFMIKKEKRAVKIGFCLLTVFLMFPIFGYIFNGFSYISNRWIWAYSLLVCMIIVLAMPSIMKFTKKQWAALMIATCVFTVLSLIMDDARTTDAFAGVIFTLLSAAVIFLVYFISAQSVNFVKNMKIAFLFILAGSILINSYYRYSPIGSNYIDEFVTNGKANYLLKDSSPSRSITKLSDDTFYRYDDTIDYIGGYKRNNSLLNGGNSVQSFYSLSNPYVYEFTSEIADKVTQEQNVGGFDARTIPETLSAVKYAVVPKSKVKKGILPFGFSSKAVKTVDSNGTKYGYYENEYALPLGYTYSSYINREQYNALTPMQKQQAVMQGVVLEEKVNSVPENTDLKFTDEEIPYTVKADKNVEYSDGKIKVNAMNSKITISFEGMENCETYVSFKGLKYRGITHVGQYKSLDEWEGLSRHEKIVAMREDFDWEEPRTSKVTVKAGGISNSFRLSTPNYEWHSTRTDFDINCHYREKAKTELTITFECVGTYSFDSMKIVCLPMEEYTKNVEQLKSDVLENIEIGTNNVRGTIDLDESKMLALAIPYSTGWTAYVDGQQVPLYRANTMYMALSLDAGSHTVELKYFTPNMKIGLIATGTGILGAAVTAVVFETRYRRKRTKQK